MIGLTRVEASDLLYALDDADRLFCHRDAEQLLKMWQRLHLACCYLDGEQGCTGTPEDRKLELSPEETRMVVGVLSVEWIMEIRPQERQNRMLLLYARLASCLLIPLPVAVASW